ncbi:MAG: hypothetical protein AB7F86_07600 [Bdellovibrionales bacterium]
MIHFDIAQKGTDTILTINGALNENAQFPNFPNPIGGRLVIDLEGVTMINSLGCRTWSQWLNKINAKNGVALQRCSPPVVHQLNVLSGFIGPNAVVESAFVTYYCDSCGATEKVLVPLGAGIKSIDQIKLDETMICPVCSALMELEVSPERYFTFVARRAA